MTARKYIRSGPVLNDSPETPGFPKVVELRDYDPPSKRHKTIGYDDQDLLPDVAPHQ
jgi:hypothetical protein